MANFLSTADNLLHKPHSVSIPAWTADNSDDLHEETKFGAGYEAYSLHQFYAVFEVNGFEKVYCLLVILFNIQLHYLVLFVLTKRGCIY